MGEIGIRSEMQKKRSWKNQTKINNKVNQSIDPLNNQSTVSKKCIITPQMAFLFGLIRWLPQRSALDSSSSTPRRTWHFAIIQRYWNKKKPKQWKYQKCNDRRNESTNQLCNPPVNHPVNLAINQTINRLTKSINQSNNHNSLQRKTQLQTLTNAPKRSVPVSCAGQQIRRIHRNNE